MVNSRIELQYKAKKDLKATILTSPHISLKKVKSFGQDRLDRWSNMLIFGDNIQALRALMQESGIKGKVRLIYIDPPFATNQEFKIGGGMRTSTVSYSPEDETAYNDRLVGAGYIEFLRERMVLLKEMLADDGSMYVHIDLKMGHYVKVLMDEIFGQERFVNDITRIKCNPKNFERKGYGNIKDIILFYTKTDHYVWNEPREDMTEEDIQRLSPKLDKDGRRYTTTPLHAPGETCNGPTGQVWKGLHPPKGRHWRYPPNELDKLDAQGLIEWSSSGNPRKKIYADEVLAKGKKRQDIWEFKDPPYPAYPTEKNLEMLEMIIEASSNPDDLVLDCFAGSGTTLVASEATKRRWIGIDNSKVAIEVCQKRLNPTRNSSSFDLYALREEKPLVELVSEKNHRYYKKSRKAKSLG